MIGAVYDGNDFVGCYRLPVWMPHVHSLIFRCNWVDQGWGDRKGLLAVVAYPSVDAEQLPENIPANDSRYPRVWSVGGRGRLVYITRQFVPHHRDALRITLPRPKPGESFFLFALAGGGGGHEIHISDVTLQTIVFDKEDRSISKTFLAMNAAGFLTRNHPTSFGLDLLGTVIEMLLQNRSSDETSNPVCAHLVKLLEENGFSISLDSLRALEEIRKSFESEKSMEDIDFTDNERPISWIR